MINVSVMNSQKKKSPTDVNRDEIKIRVNDEHPDKSRR